MTRARRSPTLYLGLLGLLIFAPAADGTVFIKKSLNEMVREADRIVQGRVIEKSTAREVEDQIWTTYVVEVDDHVKTLGTAAPKRVVIKQPGGTIGDFQMEVVGMPHFEVGQEIFAFTRDYGAGWQTVQNGPQGRFFIGVVTERTRSGATVQRKVLPGLPGVYSEAASPDLEAFKAQVRAIMATQAAQRRTD